MQTQPHLYCIMSTQMCVDVCVCVCACSYACRCPCAKTGSTRNGISPPPSLPPSFFLSLSVSLTSQHAALGQTCISLHLPLSLSFFIPSSLLPTPLCRFSPPFVVREEGSKHERQQNVNARVCVEAHMVAVALAAISQSLFSRRCFLVLIKHCCEVNQQDAGQVCRAKMK